MSESKRLFFAIELPTTLQRQIVRWRASHITLLRDAGQAVAIPPPGFHWSFQVNEFALYESAFVQGRTRYTPLQRWTLGDTLRNPDEV